MDRQETLEAIHLLKARYFRFLDTKQWDAFGALFTANAELHAGRDPQERFAGREAIVRGVAAALEGAVTVHHGHMPEIEITGETTASGIWAMEDHVELPRLVLRGAGHYHDDYALEGGVWRIRKSRLVRLRRDVERRG